MKSNKHKNSFSYALTKSVPIMCSYFFVSMAYGMMMTANGFPWYDSLLVSMTALFVILFIDQWEKTSSHIPACLGLTVAGVCLMLFGETGFMLPALIIVSAILVFYNQSKSEGTANSQ